MYRKYPKYKDSGIEWIGKIPVHWQKRRVKSVMDYIVNGIWGEDPVGDKNDIVCVRVADFDMSKLGISKENLTQRNINMSQQNNRMLSQNDILIEKSGGGEKQTVGRVISIDIDEKAVCSNFVGKIAIKSDEIIPRFGTYLFFSMYAIGLNQKAIKQTTGIQNLDTDNYFNEYFYTPSFEEQKDISEYLDRKTAQIDELVAKKKRMIELLKEERTAIINQAVTKGLDPKAEMDDSGIEWLGKIPRHWRIGKTRFSFFVSSGSGFPDELQGKSDGEYPFYKVSDINLSGTNVSEANNYVSKDDVLTRRWKIIPKGSILLAKIGAALAKNHRKLSLMDCLIDNNMMAVTPSDPNGYLKYYYYLMSVIQMEWFSNPGAVPSVDMNRFRSFSVPKIEHEEQKAIADYLDRKLAQIDSQVAREKKSIELLKEYRTALISEVVTGKIDVRN